MTFHAPKVGPLAPDKGPTLTTNFFVRRYLFGPQVYVVAGVNRFSSALLDATATSAATGIGAELGDVRLHI